METTLEVFFLWPREDPAKIKLKAVEMRLAGIPIREIMEQLGIKNKTHVTTWLLVQKWRNSSLYPAGRKTVQHMENDQRLPLKLKG
jgi:hypothetical protein